MDEIQIGNLSSVSVILLNALFPYRHLDNALVGRTSESKDQL